MTTEVLITGGAGYIGSILTPALLEEGYKVTVVDNFMYDQNSLAGVCANERFTAVRGDVRVKEVMEPLVTKADIVIPLAALVGAPICSRDPITATTVNHDAIIDLLSLLSLEQTVLMPVTNSGYGIGNPGEFCTEESPLNPLSRYGKDKVEVEKRVLDRGNAISFRLATVFGMAPRMRIDLLVNDFTYRAMHEKSILLFEADFMRNYIHVRDVADVFLHGIRNLEVMRDQAYNVGLSNANLSKRQLAEKIREQLPSCMVVEAPFGEDPDKRDYLVSNKKIEGTGFRPQHDLDSGIRELIKGYTMIRNTRYGNV